MKLSKWMCISVFFALAPSAFCQSALHEAIMEGPRAVRKAIADGANVNEPINGKSPLTAAIGTCDARVVQELISAGADLSMADKNGRTPLMVWAGSSCNDREVLKVLSMFRGDVVNMQDAGGNTALMFALSAPQPLSRVRELIQAGANMDIFNHAGENAVMIAARKDPNLVRQITNSANQLDETLFVASYLHNLPAVKGLLRAGSNPNRRWKEKDAQNLLERLKTSGGVVLGIQNALTAAASSPCSAPENGDLVVREIYNAGGSQGVQEAFWAAVYHSRPDALEELLKLGGNPFAVPSAVYSKRVTSVWALVSMLGYTKKSPNYLTGRKRKAEVVSLLAEAGLPVDQKIGYYEETPLMDFVATDTDCILADAVRVLLQAGANKNKRNQKGETAYDITMCSEVKNLLKPDNTDKPSVRRNSSGRRTVRPNGARRR